MTPIEDFAWVKERSECSLAAVFETLRQQVRRDVDTRQQMRRPQVNFSEGQGYSHSFRLLESRDNFTVLLEGPGLDDRVSFLREARTIKATNADGEKIVEGAPSLNEEGKCVIRIVGGKEVPVWYFRKIALEQLFFDRGL